jgi:phosphoribosylformimino-5-aminoimidazole carboxamide ribotide isomerase
MVRFFYLLRHNLNAVAKLKVIPVIDILNGVVVHALRGQRKEYQPLKSSLTNATNPIEVADTFKKLGFTELYIADLDAIINCSMDFPVLNRIADQTGLALMVDAGVTSVQRAQRLLDSGVAKLVIGTETLERQGFVEEAVKRFGSNRVVVSLDLRGEKVIVKVGFDGYVSPLCLLREFNRMGLRQVIVLDLARVGSGEGVNLDFLKSVVAEVGVDVYVGGGVRDFNDLVELKKIGICGALVATALHDDKIPISELKQAGFL